MFRPSSTHDRRTGAAAPDPATARTHRRDPAAILSFAAIAAAGLLGVTEPASAQADGTGPIDGPPPFLVLGAGALPEYEGADALRAVPLIVARARIGGAPLEITGTQARLGLVRTGNVLAGPVLGIHGARDEDVDDDRVARLESVDASLEPGAFVAWRTPLGGLEEGTLELGATLTGAAGGDWEGTELALGADYSWAATPIWRLALGASVTAVDDAYADSRFGVSAEGAAASGLAPHDPSGGAKDASVSLRSILSFSPRYGVFTRLAYTRLLDGAADGPLVDEAGSVDQAFVGAGLFVSFGR